MSSSVVDRENAARAIISAAETHAATISQAFKDRFGAYATDAEKNNLPDLGLAVTLAARALAARRDDVIAKSQAHEKELSDDDTPRKERDAATAALVSLLVAIRGSIDNVYGAPGLKVLALEGRTPTDPKPVLDHARKVLGRLQDEGLVWPPATHDGVTIDKSVWIAKLAPLVEKLDTALQKVATEEREAQVTLSAKNKALQEFDAVLDPAGDLIATGLDLIGLDELAEKVWPKTRRSRGGTAPAAGAPANAGDGASPAAPPQPKPGG